MFEGVGAAPRRRKKRSFGVQTEHSCVRPVRLRAVLKRCLNRTEGVGDRAGRTGDHCGAEGGDAEPGELRGDFAYPMGFVREVDSECPIDLGVDEAGHDVAAGGIERRARTVESEVRDLGHPVCRDRDVGACEISLGAVRDVGDPSPSNREAAGLVAHGPASDAARTAPTTPTWSTAWTWRSRSAMSRLARSAE